MVAPLYEDCVTLMLVITCRPGRDASMDPLHRGLDQGNWLLARAKIEGSRLGFFGSFM